MTPTHEPDPLRYDGRMPYRRCGRWGLKLPAVSLGCWQHFGGPGPDDTQRRMLYAAFDAGITHIDLANNYGPPPGSAESNVGEVLSGLPRDELIVSTKAGYDMWPGPYGDWGSRKYLLASLDQSLRRLRLDYVDIFYVHRFDDQTPLDETLGAVDTAVRQGKALYGGISSFSAGQTAQAALVCQSYGLACPVIHQPNYSMLNRWIEPALIPTAASLGLGLIAFCPLYQGLLTSKYLGLSPPVPRGTLPAWTTESGRIRADVLGVVCELADHARKRGQSLSQMAIAWVLRNPTVTSALVGANTSAHVTENAAAVRNLAFEADELTLIDSLLARLRLPSGCDRSCWL